MDPLVGSLEYQAKHPLLPDMVLDKIPVSHTTLGRATCKDRATGLGLDAGHGVSLM